MLSVLWVCMPGLGLTEAVVLAHLGIFSFGVYLLVPPDFQLWMGLGCSGGKAGGEWEPCL